MSDTRVSKILKMDVNVRSNFQLSLYARSQLNNNDLIEIRLRY